MFIKLLGFILLIIPFLPLNLLFGESRSVLGAASPEVWLLGCFIVLVLSWLAALFSPDDLKGRFNGFLERKFKRRESIIVSTLLVLLVAELYASSAGAFKHKALLVDSIAQLFQARIFGHGLVAVPAPRYPAFFVIQHLLFDDGKLYAQYPPLHSALLTPGVLSGQPWIIPILFSTGTALLLYLLAKKLFGGSTGLLTLTAAIMSPFFVFMGASFMNHVTALFFVTLFVFSFVCWEEGGKPGWLSLAGAALACVFLTRPLTAVAYGLPFFFFALPVVVRRSEYKASAAALLFFLAVCSFYFIFNQHTTGDPFLPGYLKLWGAGHGIGFHRSPWGEEHTPFTGLRNETVDLSILNEYLYEWPVPALLPLALCLLSGLKLEKWDKRLLLSFFAVPCAYFFYWHRDQFLGPRFLYETLAVLFPLYAHLLIRVFMLVDGRHFRLGPLFKPISAGSFCLFFLFFNLLYGWGAGIPQRYEIYRTGMKSMKVDLLQEAEQAGLHEGLIFTAVSWGGRIIANLRESGAGAAQTEYAYRTVDHCLLFQFVQEHRDADPEQTAADLERLVQNAEPVVKLRLNGDLKLRLRPGVPLTPECAAEIRYDQAGYMTYEEMFLVNTPFFDGRFVVARDLRERNKELMALYPDKPAYLYRNHNFERLK